MTTCSAVHRTPRDVRRYLAMASRNGRYPRRSVSFSNHELKLRARCAAIRPQTSDGNSLMAGTPIRKGRMPSTKARSIQGCGGLYVEMTRRMYAGVVVAWLAGRGASTRLTHVPNPTREVMYPSDCRRSKTLTTVPRESSYWLAKSLDAGSLAPGASRPSRIAERSSPYSQLVRV